MEVLSLITVAYFILLCFFCYSSYKVLQQIPENFYQFPAWFVWMMLIPIVGYAFIWLMIPFGIPNAIKNYASQENSNALPYVKKLFNFGLAYAILILISVIPVVGFIASIIALVVFVLYWTQLIKFRKEFLDGKTL